jgi:predicted NAD-dependent protein-ADP-ribosyltransferase YbiA (DUF1768 family)
MVPRPGWEEQRISVMEYVQMQKFLQYPDLANKLLATGDAELEYNITCGDTYWGIVDGVGENNLGKVLMKVRDRLSQQGA